MVDLRQGIVETANALGMSPIDLATIISYETGGTFNPTQGGPTTKWGKHRGLIQFGEPQAKRFGVDWNDPLGSQLGPGGAIVRYFRESGWKPGMGMLDAYSIVNAGAPGRYNASDVAAGGAPGTVRDKVEQQMGGHRQKAASLFGEGYADQGSYDPRLDTPSSGRSVGSKLPGPPDQYDLRVRHPPIPTTGSPSTTADADLADIYARMYGGKSDRKTLGEIMGGAIANMGADPSKIGMGNAPQLPQSAPSIMPSMPTVDPQQAEARRQQLAYAMQRLNQGTLI